MNNDRIIVLENVSSQAVGLKDTQTRTYRLAPGAKIRISKVSLQDILDYPASKIIFAEGLVKISNIDAETLYNMGLTEVETSYGNKVRVYDIERCICDIIRSKKRMDLEHIKYSIRSYIKRKDKNINKLSEYAEKLGIKEEVMNYIEIFHE